MFDPEMEVLVVDDAGAMHHTPFNAQTLQEKAQQKFPLTAERSPLICITVITVSLTLALLLGPRLRCQQSRPWISIQVVRRRRGLT